MELFVVFLENSNVGYAEGLCGLIRILRITNLRRALCRWFAPRSCNLYKLDHRIVGPLQKCLALAAAAKNITRLTIGPDLPSVS